MTAIDQAFIRAYEIDDETPRRIVASTHSASVDAPPRTRSTAAPHFRLYAEPSASTAPEAVPPLPTTETSAAARQPLSRFTVQPAVEARFRPALEVDAFRWTPACEEIVERHKVKLRPAIDALLAADDAGRSLIGVGGACAPGRRHDNRGLPGPTARRSR